MVSDHVVYANTLHSVLDTIQEVSKAPPGPKPDHFGPDIFWDERSHRWRKPEDDESERVSERSSETKKIFDLNDTQVRNMFESPNNKSLKNIYSMSLSEDLNSKFLTPFEHKSILVELRMSYKDIEKPSIVVATAYSHPDTVKTGGMREIMDIIEERARRAKIGVKASMVVNPHMLKFLKNRGYESIYVGKDLSFKEWLDKIREVDASYIEDMPTYDDAVDIYEKWGGFIKGDSFFKDMSNG